MENSKMPLMGLLVIAGLGLAWFLGVFEGVDPAVAEAERYRDTELKNAMNLPEAERRNVWQGMRERVDKLNEEQRKAFEESSRPIREQMFITYVKNLQQMPKADRDKVLDQFIDRMQEGRARAEANRGSGNSNDSGSGDDEDRRNRWRNMSDAEREEFRKKMLDRTSPEMRAIWDAGMDMLNERMEERGLEPIKFPWGGR